MKILTPLLNSLFFPFSSLYFTGPSNYTHNSNTKNQINAIHRVFTGSLNASVAHPREIFRSAILNNGARIILYHNHPSSDLTPSEADLGFTRRMTEAGEVLGIELLDHFIVSERSWLSFKEIGLL